MVFNESGKKGEGTLMTTQTTRIHVSVHDENVHRAGRLMHLAWILSLYMCGTGVESVLVNPQIIERGKRKGSMVEGCLSFPGLHASVTV